MRAVFYANPASLSLTPQCARVSHLFTSLILPFLNRSFDAQLSCLYKNIHLSHSLVNGLSLGLAAYRTNTVHLEVYDVLFSQCAGQLKR